MDLWEVGAQFGSCCQSAGTILSVWGSVMQWRLHQQLLLVVSHIANCCLGSPTNITPFAHYWSPHCTNLVYIFTLRVCQFDSVYVQILWALGDSGWLTTVVPVHDTVSCVFCQYKFSKMYTRNLYARAARAYLRDSWVMQGNSGLWYENAL